MNSNRELTDGQRSYLRGLPLYPWAVWSWRFYLGALASMLALSAVGRGELLAVPGVLVLFSLVLVGSVAKRLLFNHMKRVLGTQRFMDQAHLSRAISQVLYRDALLGRQTRK